MDRLIRKHMLKRAKDLSKRFGVKKITHSPDDKTVDIEFDKRFILRLKKAEFETIRGELPSEVS
jgi:hypothetical protein